MLLSQTIDLKQVTTSASSIKNTENGMEQRTGASASPAILNLPTALFRFMSFLRLPPSFQIG